MEKKQRGLQRKKMKTIKSVKKLLWFLSGLGAAPEFAINQKVRRKEKNGEIELK